MIISLQEHSTQAATSIKALAGAAQQTVLDQLREIKNSLPYAVEQLSPAERHEAVEELRRGLITWATEIDPVVSQLRHLIIELQSEVSKADRQETKISLMEEDQMPWTQATAIGGQEKKNLKQRFTSHITTLV